MAATTASNHEIARLANAHARADFATWLMMAKLKSVDALPKDAQDFYAGYLQLLERPKTTADVASEATIQLVYVRYYEKMGGTGKPPRIEPAPRAQPTPPTSGTDNVTPFRRIKPAAPAPSSAPQPKKLPVALIFIAMIGIAVAIHYAKTGF